MNPKTELHLNQMAADIHLVTAPIRWVVDYVKFVVLFSLTIGLLPLVLIALAIHRTVTGHAFIPNLTSAVPALFLVLGPLMTLIVYCVCTYSFGKGYRGIHPAYVFFLTVMFEISSPFVGLWHKVMMDGVRALYIQTETGFTVLVMFLSSPILLALYRRPQSKKGFLFGFSILLSFLGYGLVFFVAVFGLLFNPV